MILNNLQINSFRGAINPITIDFDRSKKITMIFAENGNGKSTIADALISLLTDNFGSLDDKSSIDLQFLKSIGSNIGDTKITLDTDIGLFSATIDDSGKKFSKYPNTGLPTLRFLRRSQIINLINLKPSERYDSLKDYIDVSNIFSAEEELRKANRDVEHDISSTVSVLSSANETLEQAWIKEEKPDGDMLLWAKTQSVIDISKDKIQLGTLNALTNEWRAIVIKYNEIIKSIGIVKLSTQAYKSAEEALKKLQSEKVNNDVLLLSLLQKAKDYISNNDELKKCPVCSKEIEKNEVVNSLNNQITSMDTLAKAAKLLEDAKKINDKNIAIRLKTVEDFSILLIKYKKSIEKYKISVPEITPFVESITSDYKVNYNSFINNLGCLNALFARIEGVEKKKSKSIQQHNFIKTQYNTISLNSLRFDKLSKLKVALEKSLSIVETERKNYYDNELLSISDEIEQMYQQIHPSEGLGGIKLFLNPKFKTSLELQANFHTKSGITPQSVYSESHLDTLGICIFLALAKKYSDGNTILVLDDVVMSVDETHLDKFTELLHDEADNFGQIIITTHYRPWKDRYRTHRAPGSKVHFIELRKWSKDTGIRIQNGRVELQELELALNDTAYFDRQIIASKSGIILENLLDYLTDTYEYYVPKRKNLKYTLGELIDTLQPKYLKNLKTVHLTKSLDASGKEIVSEIEYPLQPVIEDLRKLLFIRNQVGAHFNLEEDASDDDVEMFGKKTLELGKLLVCNETGQLPLYKSVDHWKSKNGSIKLYPSEKI